MSETSSARRWLGALAAPIRVRTGGRLDDLAGGLMPGSRDARRYARSQLEGLASIGSREDVLAQLASYLGEGLRAEYAALTAWRQALPAAARVLGVEGLDHTARMRRFFVLDHGGAADECDITAWDTARIVHYAGLAWAAGWLAEHEAVHYAGLAARLARAAYASWDAYGRGFVFGRWYWQGYWNDDMTTAAQGIARITADADGPWALPWSLDLGELAALTATAPTAIPAMVGTAVRPAVDCPACLAPILVRAIGDAVRCDTCGEASEAAMRLAWGSVVPDDDDLDDDDGFDDEDCGGPSHDHDDDDDDDDDDHDGDDDDGRASPRATATDAETFVNLDDCIVTAQRRDRVRPLCRCGQAIGDDEIVAAAGGAHRCACGIATAVTAVPAWLTEKAVRARFVVGGPLVLGRPDDFLYLMMSSEG
ncbi:MAG: DUF1266 domain-containing protein [Deltaproteobacteria bacterium]|nr:DUF1266 domain-containing protein [Deltaproteobacteria bacterium]